MLTSRILLRYGAVALLVAGVSLATGIPASLQQVEQLIQKGELAAARAEIQKALREHPDEGAFYDLAGVIDAQQGNYRAAEGEFRTAIAKSPDLKGAYLNLGHLYVDAAARDNSAAEKAISVYSELLRRDPQNAEANYQSALLLMQRRSYSASLGNLSRLSSADQSRSQALAVRCADYAGLRREADAERCTDNLLAAQDATAADLLSIVPALSAAHRADLNAKLLRAFSERQPSAPVLHALASAYQEEGQLVDARAMLERVAQLEPLTANLLLQMARIAYQQRDFKGALGYVAHARDLEPRDGAVHFFFGILCVELDLAQEAQNALEQAVKLDPSNPYYNYALGSVLIQHESPREAIPLFERYCRAKPDDPHGKYALAVAHFYNFDYDFARRQLEAIASDRRTAAGAEYFLGRIDNQEGHLDDAARELQTAVDRAPGYADAYAELGMVYIKMRRFADAQQALDRAISIAPETYLANLNLLILYQRTKDPRAQAQAQRFNTVRQQRSQRAKEFFRQIEIRP